MPGREGLVSDIVSEWAREAEQCFREPIALDLSRRKVRCLWIACSGGRVSTLDSESAPGSLSAFWPLYSLIQDLRKAEVHFFAS